MRSSQSHGKLIAEHQMVREKIAKREAARPKFEPKFEADPELRASAEAYKKYLARQR